MFWWQPGSVNALPHDTRPRKELFKDFRLWSEWNIWRQKWLQEMQGWRSDSNSGLKLDWLENRPDFLKKLLYCRDVLSSAHSVKIRLLLRGHKLSTSNWCHLQIFFAFSTQPYWQYDVSWSLLWINYHWQLFLPWRRVWTSNKCGRYGSVGSMTPCHLARISASDGVFANGVNQIGIAARENMDNRIWRWGAKANSCDHNPSPKFGARIAKGSYRYVVEFKTKRLLEVEYRCREGRDLNDWMKVSVLHFLLNVLLAFSLLVQSFCKN